MASNNMQKAAILIVTTELTQREISEKLGINECTLSRWKNSEEFKTMKAELQKEYLNDLTAPAMRTMKKLLNAKSELVRYNAAKDILDRTGYKPTDKVDANINLPTIISGSEKLED